MTACVCVLSLLSATIFPGRTVDPSVDAPSGPLRTDLVSTSFRGSCEAALMASRTAPWEITCVRNVEYSIDDFTVLTPWNQSLIVLPVIAPPEPPPPVAEEPGRPSPDSEPWPPRPRPEPDGPPIPAPRNSGSVRDEALDELWRLGAVQWQVDVFDCIGWRESGWQSKRSNRMNSNGTYDHGPFQINDIHWSTLNRLGLDPYNPRDAARYAWRLSGNGTYFRAWSVASACGV